MTRAETMALIGATRAVGIVRSPDEQTGTKVAEGIVHGGLPVIEVSLTTPGAVRIIEHLVSEPGVCAGAGTVMTVAQVHQMADIGVSFIVTPHLDEEIVAAGLERGIVMGPGVFTATECARALAAGADLLKLFPAGIAGVSGMKALMDPFPQARWLPTGGVGSENIAQWLDAGALAAGVGSDLTRGGIEQAEDRARHLVSTLAGIPRKAPQRGANQ